MANKITQDMIIEMNKLYLQNHNYSKTAREIGVSPGTVKKYIIPNFVDPDTIKIKKFESELPDVDFANFPKFDWSTILKLNEEENKEIEELWKELVI